jgi:hypothetical protein
MSTKKRGQELTAPPAFAMIAESNDCNQTSAASSRPIIRSSNRSLSISMRSRTFFRARKPEDSACIRWQASKRRFFLQILRATLYRRQSIVMTIFALFFRPQF